MFVAPAVACETSEPPRMPRGTSCSAPGLTSFMRAPSQGLRRRRRRSGDGQIVVEPLRALGANRVAQRLRSLRHAAELPAGDAEDLAVDVVAPRRAQEEDAAGGLLRHA